MKFQGWFIYNFMHLWCFVAIVLLLLLSWVQKKNYSPCDCLIFLFNSFLRWYEIKNKENNVKERWLYRSNYLTLWCVREYYRIYKCLCWKPLRIRVYDDVLQNKSFFFSSHTHKVVTFFSSNYQEQWMICSNFSLCQLCDHKLYSHTIKI